VRLQPDLERGFLAAATAMPGGDLDRMRATSARTRARWAATVAGQGRASAHACLSAARKYWLARPPK
jgi:hypothetical protein